MMPDRTVALARALIEAGAKGVEDAGAEIQALQAGLNALEEEYRRGKRSIMDLARESQGLRARLADLQSGIAAAEAAVERYGSAQAAAAALANQSEAASRSYGKALVRTWSAAQVAASPVSSGVDEVRSRFVELARELGLFQGAAEAAGRGIRWLQHPSPELEARPSRLSVDPHEMGQAQPRLGQFEETRRALDRGTEARAPGERDRGQPLVGPVTDVESGRDPSLMNRPGGKAAEEPDRSSMAGPAIGRERAEAESLKEVAANFEQAAAASRRVREEIRRTGDEAEAAPGKVVQEAGKGNAGARKPLPARLRAERNRASEAAGLDHDRSGAGKSGNAIRDRESERFARALAPSVGKQLFEVPDMGEADLQAAIRTAMVRAGVSAETIRRTLAETAQRLREDLRQEVSPGTRQRGLAEEAAGEPPKQERDRQWALDATDHPAAESTTRDDYLRTRLVTGASRPAESPALKIAPEQIAGLNERLDGIREAVEAANSPRIAVFGPRGTR